MRIGFLTPYLTRSGGGLLTSTQRLAQTLAPDVEVRVFGPDDPEHPEDLATWQPLSTQAFRVFGPRIFGCTPQLGRALDAASLDLVHTHGLWTYQSIAAQRSGKPGVISPHGMLDPWALALSGRKKQLAGALFQNTHLRRAACIHALCESEASSIRAYGLRNPICVIPNGIDLPLPNEDPAPWAGRIPSGENVLLYLGRLHPKKGLANLLRAWPSTTVPWHLVIAGWDQAGHEAELRQLAKEVRAERVHFAGPLFGSHKLAAYRHADAFILPSLSEGLPMVILEAWAHGKPVLMTKECHLPEGFAAHAAVRITPDPAGITTGLRELTAMPDEQRREMGARGRELAALRFSWQKVARDFQAVYRWVLDGGQKPDCVTGEP